MYVKRHAYVASGALLLIGAIVCSATWMLGLTRVWYQWGFFGSSAESVGVFWLG